MVINQLNLGDETHIITDVKDLNNFISPFNDLDNKAGVIWGNRDIVKGERNPNFRFSNEIIDQIYYVARDYKYGYDMIGRCYKKYYFRISLRRTNDPKILGGYLFITKYEDIFLHCLTKFHQNHEIGQRVEEINNLIMDTHPNPNARTTITFPYDVDEKEYISKFNNIPLLRRFKSYMEHVTDRSQIEPYISKYKDMYAYSDIDRLYHFSMKKGDYMIAGRMKTSNKYLFFTIGNMTIDNAHTLTIFVTPCPCDMMKRYGSENYFIVRQKIAIDLQKWDGKCSCNIPHKITPNVQASTSSKIPASNKSLDASTSSKIPENKRSHDDVTYSYSTQPKKRWLATSTQKQ